MMMVDFLSIVLSSNNNFTGQQLVVKYFSLLYFYLSSSLAGNSKVMTFILDINFG